MRVSEGARKINGQGGAIFIHEGRCEEAPIDAREVMKIAQSPIAPIEARDFVYGRLIELSPAALYRGMLINSETGLLAREFDERHFSSYGALPAEWRLRERIARQLQRDADEYFQCAGSLRGVPGFWEDRRGAHLWKERDYLAPSLLVPVRDDEGRIQACQMRLLFIAKKGLRYLWLSSSNLPLGCGSGSPLHFKFRLADLPRDARIVIVEGVLKADVLFALRPELYIVATPCVTANHDALIHLTRGRHTLIAFDQDYYSNKAVCFHLASLVAKRMRSEGTLAVTRIASWDCRFKGIDDAAIRKIPISSISVQSWLGRLSPQFQQTAIRRFAELGAFPFQTKNKGGSQAAVATRRPKST